MADYQAGTGPDRLPHGQATKLNQAQAPAAHGPDMGPPAQLQQDIPVEYGDPQKVPTNDPGMTDNIALLTGPSDPEYKPPADRASGRKVSQAMIRALPLLAVGTKSPDAPRSLLALYRSSIAAVEAENKEYD